MYRKDSTGWIKHVDFIILDLICLQVAFVLAYALSGYGVNPYQLILYRNMAVVMEVADLVVLFAMGTLKNVLKRGYYKDFVVTAQHGVILGACLLLYLFMLQEGHEYSRLALILNIVIYILLTYLVRELWKHLLRKEMEDGENRSLLLVVSADVVSAVVESMKEHNYARYKIAGIAVIDKEMTGKYIDGVKEVANMMAKKLGLNFQCPYESAVVLQDKGKFRKFLSDNGIVHGMGKGILRNGIRKKLDHLSYVKEYRDGGPNEGGLGVTVVKMCIRDSIIRKFSIC